VGLLIDLIVQGGCLLDILQEGALDVDLLGGAAQQDMVFAGGVVQLEEELGGSRIVADELVELGDDLVVEQIGGQRDGDAVDRAILDGLQVLYVLHF